MPGKSSSDKTPARQRPDDPGSAPSADQDAAGARPETLGERIRLYRQERGMTLSQLAIDAKVSKGYLSSLEHNHNERRPSAEIMYALAEALGVTMSDLMGRKLLPGAVPSAVPESLREFASEADLSEADLAMLASIQFRGEQPRSAARWRYIYESIRNSAQMDSPR
jgi:transcriptional regulator with XRE-family HTH domain